MTRNKFTSPNTYKIITIGLSNLHKDVKNKIREFKPDKNNSKSIYIPLSFYKLTTHHKNTSLFITNICNMFYQKIKNINFKYHFFSHFVVNAFVDYLINNEKITNFLKKENIIYADNDIIIIDGKKRKIIRKLD